MSCNCHEMNRRELFEYINQISFAVDDVKLFLDTHPEIRKHLNIFKNIKRNVLKHSKNMQRYTDL